MSILGDAIRSNADLHQALYRIVADLAASRISRQTISPPHLDYLCELAAAALPHLPPPAQNPS